MGGVKGSGFEAKQFSRLTNDLPRLALTVEPEQRMARASTEEGAYGGLF